MLKKLLKYEFKSTAKTIIPLLLGTLALSVLSAILISINIRNIDSTSENYVSSNALITLFTTLAVFSVIAIFAASMVLVIFLFARYYRNFFGDEGYLTFTLPAEPRTHLASKFIVGFTWTIIGSIVVFVAGCIIVFFGTASSGEIFNINLYNGILEVITALREYIGTSDFILYIIEFILAMLFSACFKLLLIYLAITLGSTVAKKHKILASIGFFLAINMVVSSITSTIASLFLMNSFSGFNESTDSDVIFKTLQDLPHTMFLFSIIITIAFSVGAFILNSHLLKKNLNLE